MALSNATRLSDFGSGIGTQGAIIQVDNANQRVGIGTTNPQYTLEVKGTFNATTLDIAQLVVGSGASVVGVVTGTSFEGDGSKLTGVSGFATALSSVQTDFLNDVFKTTYSRTIPTSEGQVTIPAETTSGNMTFTRLNEIIVGSGATIHVSAGVTFMMNVLNIF